MLVDVAEAPSRDAARRVHALAAAVLAEGAVGVRSVTPGFTRLLVEFDVLRVDRRSVEEAIRVAARHADDAADARPRHRTIPVVYGGEFGPDLEEAAQLTELTPAEFARLHAGSELEVQLLGFAPGFPYLGDLPTELEVPRLATPRTSTPAGSVAVTGRHSGIYPVVAPGGWRVIGRTPIRLFDPSRTPPAYLLPGDRVTFSPIESDAFAAADPFAPDW